MDTDKYLGIFIDEASEHIQNLNDEILVIEKNPDNQDTINEIFRAAHSLKGMAGTMGFKNMQNLTHEMENVFSEVRNNSIKVNENIIDILFACLDALQKYLDVISSTGNEGAEDNKELADRLKALIGGNNDAKDEGNSDNKKINFSNDEKQQINKLIVENHSVYKITVTLSETCALRSARAFLIFKNIEAFGTILKSFPNKEIFDSDEFDFIIQIIVATDNDIDKITSKVKRISEIRDAVAEKMEPWSDAQTNQSEKIQTDIKTENDTNQTDKVKNIEKNPDLHDNTSGKSKSGKSVKVDIEKLDQLMNLVSELIITKNGITQRGKKFTVEDNIFADQVEYLESITSNLHEKVMDIRMMPIEIILAKFPRMMRDLQKKLSKEFDFEIVGEDTRLDRTVLDEIGDPLMHLLRNSADHGIESPEIREQEGKPRKGKITLCATQEGQSVILRVTDDGNGIDTQKIKKKAIEKNMISSEQATKMTEKESMELLFLPGFSTSEKISDVSGRGVGLDVVKTKIESLSGSIYLESEPHKGSSFTIRLPMTLAIMQALMVKAGDETYAVPIENIQMIEDLSENDIFMIQDREVIQVSGNIVPIVELSRIFDIQSEKTDEKLVVVLKRGDKYLGLVVDGIINQQDIAIKSLGSQLESSNKEILGATIMGNGEVVLIIDTNAICTLY